MKKLTLDKIKTSNPFDNLFPIRAETLDAVTNHIRDFGYDESQPIVIWKGKNLVIDGHTRLQAAINLGIFEIPISEKEFQTENDALIYAIHNQRDRRNMTDSDILRCVVLVDERKSKAEAGSLGGKASNIRSNIASSEPSHKTTAEIVGVSPSKVQQIRKIIDEASEEEKNQITSNEKSIHSVYQEIKEREKQSPKPSETPTFNMTNDKIKWAKWSWNPVTGCKHECKYCYAKDIANRFYPEKFEPTFRPERLTAPFNTKIPKDRKDEEGIDKVFLVSMGDLFGEWVPEDWISQIMDVVENSKNWTYIALTKNPKRYLSRNYWPENLWIGATADTQIRADIALDVFSELKNNIPNILFLSCEPLMESIVLKNNTYDWLIVGGRSSSSGMIEGQPDTEWLIRLSYQTKCEHNKKIYWKENLKLPQEYPTII